MNIACSIIFAESKFTKVSCLAARVSARGSVRSGWVKVSGAIRTFSRGGWTGRCANASCGKIQSHVNRKKRILKPDTAACALFNMDEILRKVNSIASWNGSITKKILLSFLIAIPFFFGGFIPNETMMPAFRMKKNRIRCGTWWK